ncbi:cupin domain-containing protein [Microbacterium gubbeenense]|uniref:cupin domain-containing protein n=1 Tax=Microbacterium gubbeenense TaxID=159896 RepID=UPI003F95E664
MSEYNVTTIGSVGSWTGKQFIEGDLGVENVGISVNATDPGDESPFWHSHAILEEIYVVLDGEGELAVGDDVVPLSAGTVVRVAPDSMRALRCLPSSPVALKWLCLRSGADSLAGTGKDATLDKESPFPWSE